MYTLPEIDKIVSNGICALDLKGEPSELYAPIEYMMSIGGKRIRPRLALLACSLFSDKIESQQVYPALGLEVFHTFTLIHDDIMDQGGYTPRPAYSMPQMEREYSHSVRRCDVYTGV